MTVTPFKDRTERCRENALELLKDALQDAESGEVVAVAMVCIDREGHVLTRASISPDMFAVIGGLFALQQDILAEGEVITRSPNPPGSKIIPLKG